MESQVAREHLLDAETELSRALRRINALRRAALYGDYDSEEFDKAIAIYRRAKQRAQAARQAFFMHLWGETAEPAQAAASAQAAEPASETGPEQPLQPTARLRFAKWLVETGRLGEW
jgi:hypothetical protein